MREPAPPITSVLGGGGVDKNKKSQSGEVMQAGPGCCANGSMKLIKLRSMRTKNRLSYIEAHLLSIFVELQKKLDHEVAVTK